jgi:transposase
MPKTRLPYAPEFRRRMIELVRAGRDPEDLAREFEPTSQSIRNRDELIKLRREVRQLRLERDILSKAAAWFARETGAVSSGSSGS